MRLVGKNLRRLRGEMRLADFARRVGYTAEHLSMIERGIRDGTQSALGKIAKKCGVTLADLFADPVAQARARKTRRRAG